MHEIALINTQQRYLADLLARNLANDSRYWIATRDYARVRRLARELMKEKYIISVKVFDNNGRILASSTSTQKTGQIYEAESQIMAVIVKGSEEEKIGTVKVKMSLETVSEKIIEIKNRAIVITLLVIIIAILISFMQARFLTSPLKELIKATKRVSDGDMKTQIRVKTRDEISELANHSTR